MYNEYFGFREPPFSIAPDPRYLYMTAQHREALAHLVYGLNSDGGCILLTGEVGTGKTTICRCLLEQIPEHAHVALVLNPKVSEIELLETICDELKIEYPQAGNTVKTYTDLIYRFLIETHRNNEKTVLIIDEAQNLSAPVLEQLRLLTNLETNQRKLLQIIILGQPELLDILSAPEMRQLAQRITARFHLNPLNRDELKAYIGHRLAVAGQNIQLFPDDCIKLLYRLSNGVPRLINILCDRTLLGAYVENRHAASPSIVKKAATEVFGELENTGKRKRKKRWLLPAMLAASLVLLALTAVLFMRLPQDGTATVISPEADTTIMANDSTEEKNPDTADYESSSEDAGENELTQDGAAEDNKATTTATVATLAGNIPPEETRTGNVNAVPADDSAAFIQALNDSRARLSQVSAYQTLFSLWHLPYKKTQTSMCRQAASLGLSCLHKQGNLNSLKMHNRPAVLTLLNSKGQSRYVTLSEINADTATLLFNNKSYRLKLGELDEHWYGQYILLWKKPRLYTRAISPGEASPLVPWLDEQLAGITGNERLNSRNYSQRLAQRIKSFQQQQGLTADGIVGPLTLIHINSRADSDLPTLVKAG